MIRKTIFWIHLIAGVTVGLVVAMMSFTGVVLMYERQMRNWVAESHYVEVPEGTARLPLEELLVVGKTARPDAEFASLLVTNDPGAPVELRAGRRGGIALNPYDGSEMETQSEGLESFFSLMTGWHRWFNVQGEGRDFWREVTGVSNVAFLFLVLSGMYLWLPAIWKKAMFKARLWLRKDYPNSKTRDYHWHHIFGIWMAIPLALVVYSGMVISYPWAANFMYAVFGAEPPVQQQAQQAPLPQPGPGGAVAANANGGGNREGGRGEGQVREAPQQQGSIPMVMGLPLASLIDHAITHAEGDWNRMTLTLPKGDAPTVQIEIDRGNGAQAHKRYTLNLDRNTGSVAGVRNWIDTPEAQRLRGITRFLHTGEVLGFWGQTIAGLASAAAVLLVWTGLALAWRRLISPLFAKKA